MSLRLLVDEDTLAKHLVHLLRNAGHDVVTVHEAGLDTQQDNRVLEYARGEDRVLLTRNCKDFEDLHGAQPSHAGIIVIYRERDPTKSMSYAAILRALANLEASGLDLAGQFISLNAWQF